LRALRMVAREIQIRPMLDDRSQIDLAGTDARHGIEGGVVHRLSKGDVITIPANTPHWWKDTSKTRPVGCYAVNFEQ
jgi:hypothetical protein